MGRRVDCGVVWKFNNRYRNFGTKYCHCQDPRLASCKSFYLLSLASSYSFADKNTSILQFICIFFGCTIMTQYYILSTRIVTSVGVTRLALTQFNIILYLILILLPYKPQALAKWHLKGVQNISSHHLWLTLCFPHESQTAMYQLSCIFSGIWHEHQYLCCIFPCSICHTKGQKIKVWKALQCG